MRERLKRAAARIRARDYVSAERELEALLELAPRDPDAHNLLGLVHLERRRYSEAIASFSTAISLRAPFPEALVNLSVVCNRTGEYELALRVCELALSASPDNPPARLNQGMAFKGLRRLAEARNAFTLAGRHPMALFNLGHTLLLGDDLANGLPLYEARRTVLGIGAGQSRPAWNGEPRPDATLLVIPEQGLGDFILMSRFLPQLRERFAHVVVQTPEPLARLVATIDPDLEIVTDPRRARGELWAPIMSLPWLLGVRHVSHVPCEPWIRVPDGREACPRPRVGINWAGNPAYAYDAVRSTTLDVLAPLLALDEVEWVSLHRGVRESEAEAHGLPQPLLVARDFLDTAHVLRGLDLVVSTETALPNLSAAMGVPTVVLCAPDADWRWSSWYADVTICRQHAPGDWSGAIAEATAALRTRFRAANAA